MNVKVLISGKSGAFLLYACFAAFGAIFFFLKLPETKGLSLEEVEQLFSENNELNRSRRVNLSVAYSKIKNPLDE